jgi:signal transduction histidine kinase
MTEQKQQAKSLAQQVRWQLLWLGSGLFVAFLLLLFVLAWHATELTTTSLMQLEAQSLVRQSAQQPHLSLPAGKTFSAYRKWGDIPDTLRRHFGSPPDADGIIYEAETTTESGEAEYLYLLHHLDDDYGELFLFSRHSAIEIEATFLDLFYVALKQAFWLTFIIFIALFFLIRWLIGRTTKPLSLLSQWASSLGKNPDQPLDVRFPVEELNQLALQLHEGVSLIQAYNHREQQFLKHASHELRTPLAIIQASLDTLDLQNNPANRSVVQRALKASANMRQLSTALLWLARESDRPVEKSQVEVRALCDQIIEEHQYLFLDRDIKVRFNISIDSLKIERDFFSIVISNLIRNALQHSTNGFIDIEVTARELRMVNPAKAEFCVNNESGFGFGLQLVQRICSKLAWDFKYRSEQGRVNVTVVFCL